MYAVGWIFFQQQKPCCLMRIKCPVGTSGIIVSKPPWEPVTTSYNEEFFKDKDNLRLKVNAQNEFIMAPCRLKVKSISTMNLGELELTHKKLFYSHYMDNAKRRDLAQPKLTNAKMEENIEIYECIVEPIELIQLKVYNKAAFKDLFDLDAAENNVIFSPTYIGEEVFKKIKDCCGTNGVNGELLYIWKDNKYIAQNEDSNVSTSIVWDLPAERRVTRKLLDVFNDTMIKMEKLPKYQNIPMKQSNTLRIMTMNVHMWSNVYNVSCKKEILEVIKRSGSDIVCLEEIQYKTKEDLNKIKKKTGLEYLNTVVTANHNKMPFGNMMLSKRKWDIIENIYLGRYNGENRSAIYARFGTLHVYCVHLDVWDDTGTERKKELDVLMTHISKNAKDNDPIVVCGDFNAIRKDDYSDEEWKKIIEADNIRRITTLSELDIFDKNKFTSVFSNVFSKEMRMGTAWSGRIVDYMFVKNIKVANAGFIPTSSSDHIPLYIDLDLKPQILNVNTIHI